MHQIKMTSQVSMTFNQMILYFEVNGFVESNSPKNRKKLYQYLEIKESNTGLKSLDIPMEEVTCVDGLVERVLVGI